MGNYRRYSSATTRISVWNTRVLRTALTALTEPRMLWRRISRYTLPRRLVAFHTNLHCFVVTYTNHQNDTCVTLFERAAVMLQPFTKHRRSTTSLGAPRITVMYAVCILIYVSMYLCIYIATHLHTLYLDWLRSAEYLLPVTLCPSVPPESPYNCRRSLKIYLIELVWDALGDGDRVNSEMHLETEIEWTQRSTWRPGSSEFGDALGGHDRANLQAVIERVWRYTWRPWSSEFGDTLCGRDPARLDE